MAEAPVLLPLDPTCPQDRVLAALAEVGQYPQARAISEPGCVEQCPVFKAAAGMAPIFQSSQSDSLKYLPILELGLLSLGDSIVCLLKDPVREIHCPVWAGPSSLSP